MSQISFMKKNMLDKHDINSQQRMKNIKRNVYELIILQTIIEIITKPFRNVVKKLIARIVYDKILEPKNVK